ncbi:MAG: DUF1638 domain-containing protein [Pseudomonadota bacterium]
MDLPPGLHILACMVFAPELKLLGVPESRVTLLEQGLHRYPDDLRAEVAAALARIESDPAVETVVLLYGYCGGGLEGLRAGRVRLVAPLMHDCVPLLLGRPPAPEAAGAPGSFYLSAGWIEHGKTPLTEYEITAAQYDEETALWVGREMLKSYRDVAVIVQEPLIGEAHRAYARRMAALFDLGFRETPGDLGWLRRVIAGQGGEGVLTAPPGRALRLADYPGQDSLAGRESPAGQTTPADRPAGAEGRPQ